jgi:type IV pilus assembly protein PilN
MIRINLLPFRQARKKENIRRQVSIFLLSIVLICLVLVWYTLGMEREIEQIRSRTEHVKVQIAQYKEKADRVTAINAKIKRLNEKLKIVSSLQVRKNEQQLLLEELADRIVKDRMWLESMTADAQKVIVKGVAYDNPTIADFMRNLEASPLFSGVDLRRSVNRIFGENVALKTFELTCTKKKTDAKETQPGKKSGKKGK